MCASPIVTRAATETSMRVQLEDRGRRVVTVCAAPLLQHIPDPSRRSPKEENGDTLDCAPTNVPTYCSAPGIGPAFGLGVRQVTCVSSTRTASLQQDSCHSATNMAGYPWTAASTDWPPWRSSGPTPSRRAPGPDSRLAHWHATSRRSVLALLGKRTSVSFKVLTAPSPGTATCPARPAAARAALVAGRSALMTPLWRCSGMHSVLQPVPFVTPALLLRRGYSVPGLTWGSRPGIFTSWIVYKPHWVPPLGTLSVHQGCHVVCCNHQPSTQSQPFTQGNYPFSLLLLRPEVL
jgi:hypothetical protein